MKALFVIGLGLGLALGLGGQALGQGRAGSETEEEQTFAAAEDAFKSNRDDEAMRLYEKVTAINPSRADPWIKRAVILYKRKAYSEAVTLLRNAQKTLPNDNGIKAQLGLSLYRAGAQDVAVAMMEEVVASESGKYQVQLQLGQHYLKTSDGKRAAAAFDAYFKSRPEEASASDAQIRPLYGTALLINRQYPEAQRELESVLKTNPNDVISRVHLGEVFTATGDCSKAINIFERLVPEAGKQPSIHYNLGTCYLKVNRKVEAQRSAEAYMAARPKEAKGHLLVGDARFENHDLGGSLTAYEQAGKLDPAHPPAARMGKVYLAQKNYPAAVGVLEKAAEGRDSDLDIQAQLAEAYAATRQPKEKLIAIGDRLAKATDPDGMTAAAVAYYAATDDARAEKLFESALVAAPQNRRAKNGLSMALQRGAEAALAKGNLAQAETSLTRAQKLDPESIQCNRNLGLVLLLEKKFPDAERVLKLAAKKVPRDVVVNRLLGRAYVGEKRRDDAIKAYEVAAQTALRTRGPALAEVYAELGPIYAETGKLDQAVTILDTAVKEAGQTSALAAAQRNLALAWYKRGLDRLKDPKLADLALDDLGKAAATPKPALSAKELASVLCASSLAALKVGKAQVAQDGFARAAKEGGCAWKPPFDKVGTDFFVAYAQYRDTQSPARRDAAAKAFQKFLPKATGPFAALLRDLIRSSYELEAYDYWIRGDENKAATALKSAAQMAAKGGKGDRRNLDHNLAVVDLFEGKSAQAEKALEELGQRPPEALVNLGILLDRQGESKRALELYRKAAERGARAPKLREWIDVKERLLAGATAGAK